MHSEPDMHMVNVAPTEPEASATLGESAADRIRFAGVRLIPAAVMLWALLVAIGFSLTHWSAGSAFERWDLSVDRWFAARRTGGWNTATQIGSHLAGTSTVIAIAVVLFIALRVLLGRWRESWFLAVAVMGEAIIFLSTTLVIDRSRPDVSRLDAAPPTSSFPSGHVAAAVALYGAIAVVVWTCSRRAWLRAWFATLAIGVPIAVALSRLYRGMHFPTDVVAGALLGGLWLTAAAVVLLRDQP